MQHRQAMLKRDNLFPHLMRGPSGWDEKNPVESELFLGCFSNSQMAMVNGIKGATENP